MDFHTVPRSTTDVRSARRLLDRHCRWLGQSQSPSHNQVSYFETIAKLEQRGIQMIDVFFFSEDGKHS